MDYTLEKAYNSGGQYSYWALNANSSNDFIRIDFLHPFLLKKYYFSHFTGQQQQQQQKQ